ncbi:VOC family protein [Dokdonia sp.]|uniref:VOC family protein n=1 Tax=Dokdonia sp. TaxID=2024995 RepID=UPI0032641B64
MEFMVTSIRTFIGAKNYDISRNFYLDLGFKEVKIDPKMSYFSIGDFGFYLQDYYVKKWIENLMVFLEVDTVEDHLIKVKELHLDSKYKGVRVSEIHHNDWGKEFFVHDPSGVLWHIGEFAQSKN